MIITYRYIINPGIYAIYRRSKNALVFSTNPNAQRGIIYIEE